MVGPGFKKLVAGRAALVLAFVGLGAVYAHVVPIGEAPDEAAHLAYVDHLLETGDLPPLPETEGDLGYEAYQPPLEYVISAVLLRLVHGAPVRYAFVADPDLDFRRAGSRAFMVQEDPESLRASEAIQRLRTVRLGWGVATVLLVAALALALVPERPGEALVAASFFVLSPQFLFVSATVNNDTAVAAFSAGALYGLVRLAGQERDSSRLWAWGAGAAAGLALWSKASGLLLLPACLLVGWWLWRRGRRTDAVRMLGTLAVFYSLWLALSAARFGVLLPPPPTGAGSAHGGTLAALLNPRWLGSLWLSFWAKLGWLNLRLPWPAYLFFLLPSSLVALGAILTVSGRLPRPRRRQAAVLLVAAVTNVALVAVYMILVDWQHQGRYLFPSLGAAAGLAALGIDRGAREWGVEHQSWGRWAPAVGLAAVVAMAAWAALVVSRAYDLS